MQKPFKVEFFLWTSADYGRNAQIFLFNGRYRFCPAVRFFEDKALDGEIALCNRITIGMSETERIESKVFEVEHKGSIH